MLLMEYAKSFYVLEEPKKLSKSHLVMQDSLWYDTGGDLEDVEWGEEGFEDVLMEVYSNPPKDFDPKPRKKPKKDPQPSWFGGFQIDNEDDELPSPASKSKGLKYFKAILDSSKKKKIPLLDNVEGNVVKGGGDFC